jgi:hypothetical protein
LSPELHNLKIKIKIKIIIQSDARESLGSPGTLLLLLLPPGAKETYKSPRVGMRLNSEAVGVFFFEFETF